MDGIINIYCDESCHLEHDHHKVMVLGAIWCFENLVRVINERVREIKVKNGISPRFEIKWVKVSKAKKGFYLDLIDYFFDDDDLHFRGLIVPDKSKLNHAAFDQTHDDWYYKMYFDLLKIIISPNYRHRVYLDYKDTRGKVKIAKLQEVLINANYDFSREIIERIQTVRSHEVELIQLTDLLIGAISYVNRGLSGNEAKEALIDRIRIRSGYSLTINTLLSEKKFNILCWRHTEVE